MPLASPPLDDTTESAFRADSASADAAIRRSTSARSAAEPVAAAEETRGARVEADAPSDPSPPDIPDESLMLRYAAGDITAFDLLYTRHELAVWRYFLRSVRQAEVADELLQDVWFAVARQGGGLGAAPGSYQPTARFRTWLFTIAHHRLVDHVRSHRAAVSLDAGSDDDSREPRLIDTLAADSGFGPLRQLQSREQALALVAAVEQLPADQRDAFLLQAEAGLSVEDIASATGVSFETAKSRLRYARNSLRRQLQEFA